MPDGHSMFKKGGVGLDLFYFADYFFWCILYVVISHTTMM